MADQNWSKYTTLVRCSGDVGTSDLTDHLEIAKPLTIWGTAQIIKSVTDPFGGSDGVLYLNGSSYITASSYPSLSGNFTTGLWFKLISSSFQNIFSIGDFSTDSYRVLARINSGSLEITNHSVVIGSTTAPAINTWNLLEVSRQDGVVRSFLNGVSFGSYSDSSSYGGHGFGIGMRLGVSDGYFTGYLCDFYIANGNCIRWANYSVPAERILPPKLTGTVKDSTNSPAQKLVCAYDRVTKALVKTQQSNPSTGVFVIETKTMNPHFVIAFDDDPVDENALIFDNITPI